MIPASYLYKQAYRRAFLDDEGQESGSGRRFVTTIRRILARLAPRPEWAPTGHRIPAE